MLVIVGWLCPDALAAYGQTLWLPMARRSGYLWPDALAAYGQTLWLPIARRSGCLCPDALAAYGQDTLSERTLSTIIVVTARRTATFGSSIAYVNSTLCTAWRL